MSTPLNIGASDKYALVAALLNCDCMKNVEARNQVVDQLPYEIRVKIIRFPGAKQDVVSIVDACLKHTGGIQNLMDVVRFFEGDSQLWQHLLELQARILTPSLESLGEGLAELSRGGVPDPALLEAYRKQIEEVKRTAAHSGSTNQRGIYLEDVMHEIDYTEVKAFLDGGERLHAEDGFAALCLIQNSTAMGGKWCLKRIQGWLHKKGPTPNEVFISPSEGEIIDAHFILKRLAAKFDGPHPTATLDSYTQSIIQRICGSIYIGGRLLIVIRQWEDFTDREATLEWLLNDFWRPLVRTFRQSENRTRARLLVVVMADEEIPQQDADGHCCGLDDFDSEKIVRLQLRAWQKKELVDWLIDYWAEQLKLTRAQVNTLAEKMYNASVNGNPLTIYELARQRLLKEAG
jgi:Effector-associated domain 2/inactive STAND